MDSHEASEERIRALAEALRAVTRSGVVGGSEHGSMHANISTANTLWKWVVCFVVGVLAVGLAFNEIKVNTSFRQEWGPKIKVMWWMKENGYTNKDIEPIGQIKVPHFDN